MIWILIALNLISFTLMFVDKRRAIAHQWRISEKMLFISAACFGGAGAWIGMMAFRHKTKHWRFKLFLPLFTLIQFILLVKLYQKGLFI